MQINKYKTLVEFIKIFKDEQTCIVHLTKMRWSKSIGCPHCGDTKYYTFKNSNTYKCAGCLKKFNVKTKSIFENSNIPLQKWFMAIYLCCSLKRGIASAQLAREIGVTQKTAWFILQRLRLVFENQEAKFFTNTVEIDETYVGGKLKNKHYHKRQAIKQATDGYNKIPVFGILQRDGNVTSIPFSKLTSVKGKDLQPVIREKIDKDSNLMSDTYSGYWGLTDYKNHETVNHLKHEYVRGNIHTNTIEGYWSILKRTLNGTYISVSRKHINRYCKEVDFRYNTREKTTEERINLTLYYCNGRLKYKELIKDDDN